jgi:NADH:ubiquinone oxidoreductase subunit 5 (subunit L)/multisubunit Na+/H+ antiporter MnhA subunit
VKNQELLLCIVFVPVIGALVLPLISCLSSKLRNFFALCFVLVSFVLTIVILPAIFSGGPITSGSLFGSVYNLTFFADKLAAFMALVSALTSAIIVFYSFGYISHYKNQNEYYLMVVLFFGAMMGLVFSRDLISLYIFWEITAITSWRLIGFFREEYQVLRADKAFLVTLFGSVLMLLGFVSIYQQNGSFDLAVLKNSHISNLSVALILAGILSKSATLPLHTWLPDAGVAPSPVTALLHAALLVKIGVYVYARLFIANFEIDQFWHIVVPAIAGASALVSAGAAMIETDLKRIIAYSTISQIGFIFLGLAVSSETAVAGALLYILMHGLAKGGLFLCAGIIEQNTKTRDITKLGGLIRTMPVTAVSFLFCSFSVMGIPPFGGFFSKYMVMTGSVYSGPLWITLIFLAGAIMTIIYLFRVFNMVFMGEAKTGGREGSAVMVISVAALAAFSLVGGILIYFPFQFALSAVQQLPGVLK